MARPAFDAGRLLERISDDTPRGMIVHDRTRLIGLPNLFNKNYVLGVDASLLYRHNTEPKMAM